MRPCSLLPTLCVAGVALLSVSCARAARSTDPAAPPEEPVAASYADAPVTITVDNRNWQDVVIHSVTDGTKVRLGMVVGATAKTFTLRAGHLSRSGELYFIADPVGDPRLFTSERVSVQPGQHIEWTLESGLERSSMMVR